jgi:hypothetical protein
MSTTRKTTQTRKASNTGKTTRAIAQDAVEQVDLAQQELDAHEAKSRAKLIAICEHLIAKGRASSFNEIERDLGYRGGYIYQIKSGARRVRFDLVGRMLKVYGAENASALVFYLSIDQD